MANPCAVSTFRKQSSRFRNVRGALRGTAAYGFTHLPLVLGSLRHGSRSAEEAIFKSEARNSPLSFAILFLRQFDVLLPLVLVGDLSSCGPVSGMRV